MYVRVRREVCVYVCVEGGVCVCEEGGVCVCVCRGRCVSIFVSVRVFGTSLVPRQHYVSIWKRG